MTLTVFTLCQLQWRLCGHGIIMSTVEIKAAFAATAEQTADDDNSSSGDGESGYPENAL